MLVPHLLKIYFGLGWPSSVLEIVSSQRLKTNSNITVLIYTSFRGVYFLEKLFISLPPPDNFGNNFYFPKSYNCWGTAQKKIYTVSFVWIWKNKNYLVKNNVKNESKRYPIFLSFSNHQKAFQKSTPLSSLEHHTKVGWFLN